MSKYGPNTSIGPIHATEHWHNWAPVGWRHVPGSFTYVVQSCVCGEAREIVAQTVAPWEEDGANEGTGHE